MYRTVFVNHFDHVKARPEPFQEILSNKSKYYIVDAVNHRRKYPPEIMYH